MTDKDTISVLVVDDSALMRNMIGRIIEDTPGLSLAGKAMNGLFAMQKIPKLNPDIIILDLEMPEMNGIEFLKERRKKNIKVPVIILSSIAKKGAKVTMNALALGASDFVTKPGSSHTANIYTVKENIIEKIKAYATRYKKTKKPVEADTPSLKKENKEDSSSLKEKLTQSIELKPKVYEKISPLRKTNKIEIIVIGISTGGPNALRKVLAGIDANLKIPIAIVQHMPAGFTEEFAKSLDKICPLEVKEAKDGDLLTSGRILIAPGHAHLTIEKKPLALIARLSESETINGHRPSVDVLFNSISKQFKEKSLAIIMTGMGKDGAVGTGSIYKEGGYTIAQNEASCVVYGMPKVAVERGFIHDVVPLQNIALKISEIIKEYSS